jgi:hypothetical protein
MKLNTELAPGHSFRLTDIDFEQPWPHQRLGVLRCNCGWYVDHVRITGRGHPFKKDSVTALAHIHELNQSTEPAHFIGTVSLTRVEHKYWVIHVFRGTLPSKEQFTHRWHRGLWDEVERGPSKCWRWIRNEPWWTLQEHSKGWVLKGTSTTKEGAVAVGMHKIGIAHLQGLDVQFAVDSPTMPIPPDNPKAALTNLLGQIGSATSLPDIRDGLEALEEWKGMYELITAAENELNERLNSVLMEVGLKEGKI